MTPFVTTELPVLLYHHIGPLRPGTFPSMTIDPRRFGQHLDWLRASGYRALSIDQVVAWATERCELPPRSLLFTFDDGYADLADTAFPLLEAAGYPATVFIVTEFIGRTNSWDDHLGKGGHRLLGGEAIQGWSQRGIEFAAHTRTHPDLSRLPREEVERELAGSRDDLEALLQRSVRAFAFPYGEAGRFGLRAAATTFAIAFNAFDGTNGPNADPHWIRRTMVQPTDSRLDIASRVRFGRSFKQDARARLSQARSRMAGQLRHREQA